MDFFRHPTAEVDEGARVGKGTRIWHFCHIGANAELGRDCVLGQNVFIAPKVRVGNRVKIQNNVSVYEGVELEDDVFCGPSLVFTNISKPRCKYPQKGTKFYEKTLVKTGATLGANATILCGITIGRHAMIGAGAVVTRDVPDFAIVLGNPARRTGWVSEAGEKLDFDAKGRARCPKSKKNYRLQGGRVEECKP
ncbi:MAG: N-acetyltransferase [Verrucomicrobiae bacterium]|nr:N-acetyltransferase [Verrucomicrobiae bacterium]